ncbi:MAG: DUF2845 domain-containing protein [Gammaproteobacteria bacterium]|nr:DUF2845 domain-containing protein [Gammaproteobacteria bacterium]
MNVPFKSCLFLSIFSLFISTPCDALRCGNNLVDLGDTMRTVKTNCGKPTHIRKIVHENKRGKSEKIEWWYDFGPRDFIYSLTFKQGKVVRIHTQGYGHLR